MRHFPANILNFGAKMFVAISKRDQMGSFFNIWPFKTLKLCPEQCLAQIGSKYCQILNQTFETLKKSARTFCQNGEISPNLVTLQSAHSFAYPFNVLSFQ